MAYRNEGPFTLTSGESLEQYRLAKMSGTTVIYADAGDLPIGITLNRATASSKPVTIAPLRGGIEKVTASKAITAGSAIYPAADGKVSDAAVGAQIGIAIETATADGGIISAVLWSVKSTGGMFSSLKTKTVYKKDFSDYDGTNDFAEISDGTPAVAVGDEAGGVLSIACTASDNDETYISTAHKIFKFNATDKLFFEARVKLTEANIDDANIIVGLSDTVGADSLLDNGAGPMASYDGAVFFKVDGGTVWQFETSNAGTQKTLADAGDFNDGEWHTLGFLYDPNDGVTANVTPYVNGVAGTAQTLTIAGLEEMHGLFGVKTGDAHAETLKVDYIVVETARAA